MTEDDAAILTTTGELSVNDIDTGEASFEIQNNTVGNYGTFSIDTNGNWTYNADNSQTAIQELNEGETLTETFTVNSLDGTSETVTVTITGTNDNQPPVAHANVIKIGAYDNASGQLHATDSDNDVSELTFNLLTDVEHGAVVINSDGSYTYTPDDGYAGEDSFTYQVTDPSGGVSTATVNIDVFERNYASDDEERVNTYTHKDQEIPDIATLSDGGYIIVWEGRGSGDKSGIFAQRYDTNGDKVDEEFRINDETKGTQTHPTVTGLQEGGFIVTWEKSGDIYSRTFDANGDPTTRDTIATDSTRGKQSNQSLTQLENGDVVLTWEQSDDIYMRIFNDDIGDSDIKVNTTTTGDQEYPDITALNDGSFVITWTSKHGKQEDIIAQHYDSEGNKLGNEITVNTHTDKDQRFSQVTALASGGFVIAWQSENQDGDEWGTYFQRFDENGIKVGKETLINTTTDGEQGNVSITGLKEGGFYVVWDSDTRNVGHRNDDDDRYDRKHDNDDNAHHIEVFGQAFDNNGNPVGSETQINTFTTSNQQSPVVTQLDNGSIRIAWESYNQDGSREGIYQTELIKAATEAQNLTGSTGNDILKGSKFNDILTGDDGDDYLEGKAGADIISGGAGVDTASYVSSGEAVAVNLSVGTASGGHAEGDLLTDIENIIGSAYDDVIIGNSGANLLEGGAGNDMLYGGSNSFIENSGKIVIEAEHFTSRSEYGSHEWSIVPTEGDGVGAFTHASSGAYVQALSDTGTINTNSNDPWITGPVMEYKMTITTTGEYQLFVSWDAGNSSANSIYARISELNDGSGGSVADWYRLSTENYDQDFSTNRWQSVGDKESTSASGNPDDMVWNITNPGEYTIEIFMREDGAAVDSLVFQNSSLSDPVGTQTESELIGNSGDDILFGGTGSDTLIAGDGTDILHGGEGDDLFIFKPGDDQNIVYGGSDTDAGGSWTDTIILNEITQGPVEVINNANDWLLETSADYTINQNKLLFDDENASGTITLNDGSTINFTDIDEIHWG